MLGILHPNTKWCDGWTPDTGHRQRPTCTSRPSSSSWLSRAPSSSLQGLPHQRGHRYRDAAHPPPAFEPRPLSASTVRPRGEVFWVSSTPLFHDPLHLQPWSSLHWASAHGNVSIVEALLSSGAAADYLAAVESPPPVSSSPCPPQAVARVPPLVPQPRLRTSP